MRVISSGLAFEHIVNLRTHDLCGVVQSEMKEPGEPFKILFNSP